MKRSSFKTALTAFLAAAITALAVGCSGTGAPISVEVSAFTAVPVATLPVYGEAAALSTLSPEVTLLPFSVTPTPYVPLTPAPTRAPSQPSASVPSNATPLPAGFTGQAVFDNCAFLGNSLFEGLHAYGVITHGKFFTTVGLNIVTVYSSTTTNGHIPVINELNTGSYAAVIMMFGQNELGWPDPNAFFRRYAQLIRDVKTRQPNARIFITAMPPVTKALSDRSTDGVTNANIAMYNAMLLDLSSQFGYCRYITVPNEMYDESGALPVGASGDGIHLNMTYSRIWAEHICRSVAAGLGS